MRSLSLIDQALALDTNFVAAYSHKAVILSFKCGLGKRSPNDISRVLCADGEGHTVR
jgi:hypothetical protein